MGHGLGQQGAGGPGLLPPGLRLPAGPGGLDIRQGPPGPLTGPLGGLTGRQVAGGARRVP